MPESQKAWAERLLRQRSRLVASLPDLTEILRGSVRQRFVRCGKAGCHCAKGRGHGPISYLTVTVGPGWTRQITLAVDDFQLARRFASNYGRVRKMLAQVSAINADLLQQRRLSGRAKARATRDDQGPRRTTRRRA